MLHNVPYVWLPTARQYAHGKQLNIRTHYAKAWEERHRRFLPAQPLPTRKGLPCKNRGGATTAGIAPWHYNPRWIKRAGGPLLAVVFVALFAANTWVMQGVGLRENMPGR